MKELNLNSQVLIPATSSVLEFLRKEHTKFWTDYSYEHNSDLAAIHANRRIAEYTDPIVVDGHIKMPLWDVMSKFGASMCPGINPLFVTILIDEKDLK